MASRHVVVSRGFAPNGKTILTYSPDKALRLWDAESGKELQTFDGDNKVVMGSFSPSGRLILSVSHERTLRLWDVETGKELRRFEGPKGKVVGAEFVAWGRQVVARCDDQKLRVWETATGKLLRELDLSKIGGAAINIMASPDGRLGLVGREDASVRVIDLDNGKEIARYDRCRSAKSFSFTPNSNFAVAGSFRAGMYVFRLPRN